MQDEVGGHLPSIRGGKNGLRQQLPYVWLESRCACVGVAAVNGVLTVEASRNAAGFLNEQLQRSKIPGRGIRFNPHISFALCEEHGIHRSAHAAYCPETLNPGE